MINFTWTQPTYPSVCYNITGYTVNNNITDNTANTTDTGISITLPNSGLSAGMYCISIASIDTANRIGTHGQKCFPLLGLWTYNSTETVQVYYNNYDVKCKMYCKHVHFVF